MTKTQNPTGEGVESVRSLGFGRWVIDWLGLGHWSFPMKLPLRLKTSLSALALLPLAGCQYPAAALGIIAQAIPKHVDAAYKGLAGQQVVVMVWADPGVRLDNPLLQEDVAAAVQDKLIKIQHEDAPDALKGTTFPVSTAVVVQTQQDHPEWENQSATDVAAQLKGSRLIYVEVSDYATRSDASQELYRGTLTAHLSVVEMKDVPATPDKATAKMAYDGGTIHVTYPKDTPSNKEGTPIGKDSVFGQKTVDAFADELTKRFYLHDEDRT